MIPVQAPSERPPENGVALAGMILGILGLVLFWLPLVGMLLALVGLIMGGLGIGKARRNLGKNFGFAITGLVCGIIGFVIGLGVLAAVAIPAFLDYQHKGKKTESSLYLNGMEKRVKAYWAEMAQLPPSAKVMPAPPGGACMGGDMKMPVRSSAEWFKDPGWRAIGFMVDEPSRYSYTFTRDSATTAHAEALGDLDCDGTVSVTRVDFEIVEGNLTTTYRDPTPD